jgi:hypothetical protein
MNGPTNGAKLDLSVKKKLKRWPKIAADGGNGEIQMRDGTVLVEIDNEVPTIAEKAM